jgi:uncharacterized protein YbjT (DUF2867 family)
MRVLLLGGFGFLGGAIGAALRAAGHEVINAVRAHRVGEKGASRPSLSCDLAHDVQQSDWLPRLDGIDAVVNASGILRDGPGQSLQAVQVDVPLALYRACAERGIRRIVQISALGDARIGEFIAAKHRLDAALTELDLDWVVLRPTLVYSARGSYGGTSLLRALAATPWVLFLPMGGAQRVRPVALEDVAQAVVSALTLPQAVRQIVDLVGPEVLSYRDYQRAWRDWLGIRGGWEVSVPRWAMLASAEIAERVNSGALGRSMFRMLEAQLVGNEQAPTHMRETLALSPRSLTQALAETPAQTQDRWHARLHFFAPALRVVLAVTWMASGVLGLMLPPSMYAQALAPTGWTTATQQLLAQGAGMVDLLLGVALLLRIAPKRVLQLMLVSVLAYTVILGLLAPALWLDPWGGLLKNGVLLMALWAALVTAETR